jgi:hypothetical protein
MVASIVKNLTTQYNRFQMLSNVLILLIFLCYILIRKKCKGFDRLYEIAILASFGVTVIACALTNTRLLPEKLTEMKMTFATNEYCVLFYTYLVSSIIKIDSYVFYFFPLFFVSEYLFNKDGEKFLQTIF